jgi:hypothetical protein
MNEEQVFVLAGTGPRLGRYVVLPITASMEVDMLSAREENMYVDDPGIIHVDGPPEDTPRGGDLGHPAVAA